MPIYEYDCLNCGEPFERFLKKADASVDCPECGEDKVQRRVSLCGVASEGRSAANLKAAHQRAAAKRSDRQRSEHEQHHEHFGDAKSHATLPGVTY